MTNIIKKEGTLIEQILTKDVKNFNFINYYGDGEYINFDNKYISLTRINHGSTNTIQFSNVNKIGQLVGGISDIYITQISSGITIPENFIFENNFSERGRAINNFKERSNLVIFTLPTYTINGADKITSAITINSSNVYIVDTLSGITFTVEFSADTNFDKFFVGDNGIKFDLYRQDSQITYNITGSIETPSIEAIFSSPKFGPNLLIEGSYQNINNFLSYTSTTFSYDLSLFEGEFLIRPLFKWRNFTYFGNILNLQSFETTTQGLLPYSIYDSERDYYFIYLKSADKPTITSNSIVSTNLPLNVFSIVPSYNGQSVFPFVRSNFSVNGTNLLVSVNGVVLSTSEYYYSANTLYITSGVLLTNDIITVVTSDNTNTPPIQTESYRVESIISKIYPDYGDKVIYNYSTNKYEYWLDYEVTNQPTFVVNGQVLSNQIDYYVSISDKRRVIFESIFYVGDEITVFYNSVMNDNNYILSNIYTLNWTIPIAPNNIPGFFVVEVTNKTDTTFSNPIFTGITFYSQGQTIYSMDIPFYGGSYGQKFLVRVTNYKNFYTISGNLIQTYKISDPIKLTIGTNALNNY